MPENYSSMAWLMNIAVASYFSKGNSNFRIAIPFHFFYIWVIKNWKEKAIKIKGNSNFWYWKNVNKMEQRGKSPSFWPRQKKKGFLPLVQWQKAEFFRDVPYQWLSLQLGNHSENMPWQNRSNHQDIAQVVFYTV